MVRRECPGCTCGVESSLAMTHAVSSELPQLGGMLKRPKANVEAVGPAAQAAR